MSDAVSVGPFVALSRMRGVIDDAIAINQAIQTVVTRGGGFVYYPWDQYLCRSRIYCPIGITHKGGSNPGSISNGATQPFAMLLHDFNGDFVVYDGSLSVGRGTGCGLERLALVQVFGVAGNTAGRGIVMTGTGLNNRPNFVDLKNVTIEQRSGAEASWQICCDIDGTGVGGGDGIRSVFIDACRFNQGVDGTDMLRLASVFNAFVTRLEAGLGTARVTVTGTAGSKSSNINFSDCGFGDLSVDFAQNVTFCGGALANITTTVNTGPTCAFFPLRFTGTFTNGCGGNAALLYYSQSEQAWITTVNHRLVHAAGVQGRKLDNITGVDMLRVDDADHVLLDAGNAGVAFPVAALAASGVGAIAVNANIGGAGRPTAAASAGWKKEFDSLGNAYWLQIWR